MEGETNHKYNVTPCTALSDDDSMCELQTAMAAALEAFVSKLWCPANAPLESVEITTMILKREFKKHVGVLIDDLEIQVVRS